MNELNKINYIKTFVKNRLYNEYSGHDYWHIVRVVNNAQKIMLNESADNLKVIIASWLHDIGDYKLHNGIDKTKEIVFPLLKSMEFNNKFIDDILKIISEVSYNGGFNQPPSSIEAKIVQDADRLDAMGAIGIARAFAYGGNKGREIYNPDDNLNIYNSKEEYKNNNSSSIMHFYEKLLKLKNLMNTDTAKFIAHRRHEFMILFLNEFMDEIKN
ncbi:HD domain-containing protein [Apibacter muscae]|uniref:HD domain-containing protein n=1 Tax=Apibacter muscae TaxID=2509004 RepID=A0A563D8N5_9FLAO|nr:HD domain-containing protein [Apibacter muscae]TWP26164.1 HD domain-containing protein [Apibacter muscae]